MGPRSEGSRSSVIVLGVDGSAGIAGRALFLLGSNDGAERSDRRRNNPSPEPRGGEAPFFDFVNEGVRSFQAATTFLTAERGERGECCGRRMEAVGVAVPDVYELVVKVLVNVLELVALPEYVNELAPVRVNV